MPDVHAKLSASGAARWINCPPSVHLESEFPDRGSSYAEEGTTAHSLAELILRYNNNEITKKTYNTRFNKLKKNEYYNQEMQEYIEDYAHTVWEIVNEVKKKCGDPEILFEQRLDFSEYVPGGFGTGDVVVVADGTLRVIDLKYGKGVGVSAEENPQLRLYGIGAYLEYSLLYDIQEVSMTIIQPRLDNTSTETLTADALIGWAEEVVKPKAALAEAGEGDYLAGDHCKFCKAKAVCRARADQNLELARFDLRDADKLEDWEIGEVLQRAEELKSWAKDVADYALDEAVNHGKKWDGWKLVEGRSNRKYVDETKVVDALKDAGYEEAILYERKLLGITAMEKVVGKKTFTSTLGDLVEKPPGKPVLAPESDKRPELSTAESAKEDFEDIVDYEHCYNEIALEDILPPRRGLPYWLQELKDKYPAEMIEKAYRAVEAGC